MPPPAAADDAYDTLTDTPLTVAAATGVLANDSGAVTAVLVAGPAHGTLTLQADGSFTYAPAPGYVGAGYVQSTRPATRREPDQADVTLTVHPKPNHPPAAGDDAFTTVQDTPLVITAAQVLANDSDPDGDRLSFASPLPLTNPDHGRLTVTTGAATYTPDAGFSGTDTFTYAVSDGRDSSPPAKVTVTVRAAGPPEVDGGGGVIIVPSPPQEGGVPPGPTIPIIPGVGLRVCAVRVQTAAGAADAVLIAHGNVKLKGTRRVAVKTRVTRDGARVLRNTVGGVTVRVRAICRAPRGGPRRRRTPGRVAARRAHEHPARLLGARPCGADSARRTVRARIRAPAAPAGGGAAALRRAHRDRPGQPRRPARAVAPARADRLRAAAPEVAECPAADRRPRRRRPDRHERDRGGPRREPPSRGHDRVPPDA